MHEWRLGDKARVGAFQVKFRRKAKHGKPLMTRTVKDKASYKTRLTEMVIDGFQSNLH